MSSYRTEGAETVVVALGSVFGTVQDVVDELRDDGVAIGALAHQVVSPVRHSTRCATRSAARAG